jgi:hypothetical protein
MKRRVSDTPVLAVLIVAVIYAVYGGLTLAKYQGDITRFIVAGDRFTQASDTPIDVAVSPQLDGYDGQFYFRLALDPLTHDRTAFGITLDLPPYRQQRIVYPAAAHVLALGHPAWIPWALVLINYLGVCAMALIGGRYAQSLGRHALWGISLPLYTGFFFSFTGNLAEITEMVLLLTALLALQRQHPSWAALFLSLAVLTKETALIAALAVGASYYYTHRQMKLWRKGIVLAAPVAVYLALAVVPNRSVGASRWRQWRGEFWLAVSRPCQLSA